jgi:hypothetical protein
VVPLDRMYVGAHPSARLDRRSAAGGATASAATSCWESRAYGEPATSAQAERGESCAPYHPVRVSALRRSGTPTMLVTPPIATPRAKPPTTSSGACAPR